MRVIVVGAGVVGTLHAWHAVERGHQVVQIEREAEARGASLRNFGQIIHRPGRNLVGLRLGTDVGRYQVALFADNLFDQRAPNIVGPFGVFAENLEQRPRTVGVSGRADF